VSAAAALVFLQACVSDPETEDLMATLPVAAICGNAAHLAECIELDIDSAAGVPEAEKSELRARAQVLEAHALRLRDAIERHDSAKGADQPVTLVNLETRAEALDEEYRTAFREWGIWQVRNGLRTPDDTVEIFNFRRALE
jgi:hypothetical protein